jgi:hypothetical protein
VEASLKRDQLEHILRAAGAITGQNEFVVLGSQAILGPFPNAPSELLVSEEVDTYPLNDPAKADLIDGTIGEMSPFHDEFGYYARGVGPETATLPKNWRNRLVPVRNENTRGVTGYCLDAADLAVSKLAAGRPKDFEFVRAMLRHKLAALETIRDRLAELSDEKAERVAEALNRC